MSRTIARSSSSARHSRASMCSPSTSVTLPTVPCPGSVAAGPSDRSGDTEGARDEPVVWWGRRGRPDRGLTMLGSAPIVAFAPTTDLARAREFFGGTLGLTLRYEDGFACVFDADGIQLRVSLVEQL